MKATVLSGLLLSTFLAGSAFAASETPMARDLTPQEMNDVVGQGAPYFRIRHTGSTWISHWDLSGRFHSHQLNLPAGSYYYAFHAVPAGSQVQLQCQNSAGVWQWFGLMPAGNYVLNCHN